LKNINYFKEFLNEKINNVIYGYRYYNDLNRYSDKLRDGTFYTPASDISGERYNLSKNGIKLGGKYKVYGYFNPQNPIYIKTDRGNSADLISPYSYYDILSKVFGNEFSKYQNFIEDLIFEKNIKNLNKIIKNVDFINDDAKNLILKQPFFNKITMVFENLLSKFLKSKKYDLVIYLDKYDNIREIFDIDNIFIETKK
jgi:hypothetical protein